MERFMIAVTIFARVWKRNRRSSSHLFTREENSFGRDHSHGAWILLVPSVQPQSLFFSWIGELG